MSSAALITCPTLTLADRIKVQQQRVKDRQYIVAGKLLTVVLERQMPLGDLSQSVPRWASPEQQRIFAEAGTQYEHMAPMSEAQTMLWTKITLDWLHHKNAPLLAVSHDYHDLLLPLGLPPLPDLPDPKWTPKLSTDVAPRIPQLLEERACGKITRRDGRVFLVFQPVVQLVLMLGGGTGGFGTIRGSVDPADRTHLALVVDTKYGQGYFVGGRFHSGV